MGFTAILLLACLDWWLLDSWLSLKRHIESHKNKNAYNWFTKMLRNTASGALLWDPWAVGSYFNLFGTVINYTSLNVYNPNTKKCTLYSALDIGENHIFGRRLRGYLFARGLRHYHTFMSCCYIQYPNSCQFWIANRFFFPPLIRLKLTNLRIVCQPSSFLRNCSFGILFHHIT